MENEQDQDSISKELNILDISEMAIPLADRLEGEDDISVTPSTSRGVAGSAPMISAVPSGSGLTFVMNSQLEDNDFFQNSDEERILNESLSVASTGTSEQEGFVKRKLELTDKYLAGQLSFPELLREISDDSEDDDEEEIEEKPKDIQSETLEETDDSEWTPSQKKSKSGKKQKTKNTKSSAEMFEEDLDDSRKQKFGKGRKKVGATRRRKRLDPALQGLMGEANLRYVRGDKENAIKMCMEVIRQDPTAPEPFQTLSSLYEDMGEQEKSLQFALIAAHLAPQDSEEWTRLADMSLEMDDIAQAALCYKKAIDADIENLRLHWTRCNLLEQSGDEKSALRGYRRLLGVLKNDQGPEYLEAAREIARLLHARQDIEGAKKVIYDAVNKFPESVEAIDINLLLELMISLEHFEEALEILCRFSGLQFVSGDSEISNPEILAPEKQLASFKKALLPEEQPLELVSKAIVVLVCLGANHLVGDICSKVLSADADAYGDLMLDVAEALMTQKAFEEALAFLQKLIDSREYGQAAVWLRYGESLMGLKRMEEAELAYQKVVELAPSHLQARRTLSNILHRLGRPDEALKLLTQDDAAELLNPTLLYEKCQLLFKEGCIEEFIAKSKLLFSRHFVHIRNREELMVTAGLKKVSLRKKYLSEFRAMNREPMEEVGPSFENQTQISLMDEYRLFRQLCDVLFEQKRFPELQRIAFSAHGSPLFNKNSEIAKELDFLCLLSSYFNEDSYHAFNLIRDRVPKKLENNRTMNLLNMIIINADDMRHNKFLMRLMRKNTDSLALGILNGHNCLVSGTYKYSLGEYVTAFKMSPKNPMLALMLGLIYIHLACQKFSAKKHSLVVQACAFLNQYLKLRGRCQESYYNLGRAMHQLGLLPAALHYYKKGLDCTNIVEDNDDYNLHCEIAFNMAIIYKNSGADDLARMYTQKYIVI